MVLKFDHKLSYLRIVLLFPPYVIYLLILPEPFYVEESCLSLSLMQNSKCPGMNGLQKDFYLDLFVSAWRK